SSPWAPVLDGVAHTGPKSAKSAPAEASPGACVETPISVPAGSRRRATSTGTEPVPSCTPSAPAASATSSRSFTKSSAPVRAVAARRRSASASSGRPGRSLSRSCTAGSPASSAASTTAAPCRSVTRTSLGGEEGIAHPDEEPEQRDAEHEAPRDQLHLGRQQRLFHHARGGTMPWKKI